MKTLITSFIVLFASLNAISQDKAVNYKELQKHLPDGIEGFSKDGEPNGSSFEMNGMSYSTAVQEYKKGDSKLIITIMDYKGAASIYQASTMAWANGMKYEDDHQKAHGVTIDGMNGWFSYNKDNKESTLVVANKDRYLVTVSVRNSASEVQAESILKQLKLSSLP